MLSMCTSITASDFESGGIHYNILSQQEATVEVTSNPDTNIKYSGDITIPELVTNNNTTYTVTAIKNKAFSSCSDLKSVIIPESVVQIGKDAFRRCPALTYVNIPMGITSIESSTFHNCTSLTEIILPEKLTTIEFGAFNLCNSIKNIILPQNLSSIGSQAFGLCEFKTITCMSQIPPLLYEETPTRVFSQSVIRFATLYVPSNCKNIYTSDSAWGQFKKISELSNSAIDDIFYESNISISSINGVIVINGISDEEPVEIFDTFGKTIYAGNASSIPNLHNGIYIIRIGTYLKKIIL